MPGKWSIEEGDGVLLVCCGVYSEAPISYTDGSVGYDWPERIPQRIKDEVAKRFMKRRTK